MKKFLLPVENDELLSSIIGSRKTGVITNQSCVDSCNKFVLPELKKKYNIQKVFVPEHGLFGKVDGGENVESYHDRHLDMDIISLYGKHLKPQEESLEDLDAVLYHVQDLGLRFYTYISTLFNFMEALHEYKSKIELIILDRPNPLGRAVEGPMLNKEFSSFVSTVPVPVRYGLTVGELALYLEKKFKWNINLKVLKMENYKPTEFYGWVDELPWNPPSSAIKDIETAFLYSGACILEGTNISEGRGTTTPFKIFGKPGLDTDKILGLIKEFDFPVELEKITFTPTVSKYKNDLCNGFKIKLKSFENFYGIEFFSYILHMIKPVYKDFFNKLVGTDKLKNSITATSCSKSLPVILQGDLDTYKKEVEQFYLY